MKRILFALIMLLSGGLLFSSPHSSGVAQAATPLPSGCYTDSSGLPVCGPDYAGPGGGGAANIVPGTCTSPSPVPSPTGGVAVNLTPSCTVSGTWTFSTPNPLVFSNTNGVSITSNATGISPGWIWDLPNASRTTGDIADWQLHEANLLQILNDGSLLSQGSFQSASTTAWLMTSTTGTSILSNAMGAATAITVNPTASPFTGNIVDFDKASVVKASIDNGGNFIGPGATLSGIASGNWLGTTTAGLVSPEPSPSPVATATACGSTVTRSGSWPNTTISVPACAPPYLTETGGVSTTGHCVQGTWTNNSGTTHTVTFSGAAVFGTVVAGVTIVNTTSGVQLGSANVNTISVNGFQGIALTSTNNYSYQACGF